MLVLVACWPGTATQAVIGLQSKWKHWNQKMKECATIPHIGRHQGTGESGAELNLDEDAPDVQAKKLFNASASAAKRSASKKPALKGKSLKMKAGVHPPASLFMQCLLPG